MIKKFIKNKIPDKIYLKYKYKKIFKKELNLNNPVTFNEKLQWLKLNDRKDIYTTMVDKYEAKKYVANIIGDEYIIPTIGIYNSFDEIDFNKLPNKFVMKCTHDSGGLVICKDKNNFDMKQISKLKKMNIKIQKINLKMVLGTEDTAQNAIIVGTISSIIAIIMGVLSEKKILAIGDGKENSINWKIIPLYQNRNLLNIDLNCIISFKLIHIINAI